MEESSTQVSATHAGTENQSTYKNTLAAAPQPEGRGKERQGVNDADASPEPSDDEACGERTGCGHCDSWRKMTNPSDWMQKRFFMREKQAYTHER